MKMDRVKCLVAKLKPPEKLVKERKATLDKTNDKPTSDLADKLSLNTYLKYKKEDMNYYYYLVNEKGISVRGVARKLKISL
ncbi:MAG: hypothetical protein EXX96DRAFT_565477 [Benjaminiella poitrasii]|nr:MAG: hypothetical protein EXX96DRAFT_565477 [Benjaminiella poitrasii]